MIDKATRAMEGENVVSSPVKEAVLTVVARLQHELDDACREKLALPVKRPMVVVMMDLV